MKAYHMVSKDEALRVLSQFNVSLEGISFLENMGFTFAGYEEKYKRDHTTPFSKVKYITEEVKPLFTHKDALVDIDGPFFILNKSKTGFSLLVSYTEETARTNWKAVEHVIYKKNRIKTLDDLALSATNAVNTAKEWALGHLKAIQEEKDKSNVRKAKKAALYQLLDDRLGQNSSFTTIKSQLLPDLSIDLMVTTDASEPKVKILINGLYDMDGVLKLIDTLKLSAVE